MQASTVGCQEESITMGKNSRTRRYRRESSSDDSEDGSAPIQEHKAGSSSSRKACECGCPCPRIPGQCGIVRNEHGKPVCHCHICGGNCEGTPNASHDAWCDGCWRPDQGYCVLCACCNQIHNSKGELQTMDMLEWYDSEVDDEEKAAANKKAEAKAKRDTKRDAKKAKAETARLKRVSAKQGKEAAQDEAGV